MHTTTYSTTADLDAALPAQRGRPTHHPPIGEAPSLRAAYRLCRRTTRVHDPGIYALIQLMPTVLRPPCWALWAAASVLDDLADQQDAQQADRETRVQAWSQALQCDLAAGTSADPVRHALVDTALRWRLDLSSLQSAMTSTRDDVRGQHFADWAAWRAWCNGAITAWVDQVRHLFERAGAPMTFRLDRQQDYKRFIDGAQLTDTLTDLSADLAQGDLLLPQEALDAFPGAEDDLRQGNPFEGVLRLAFPRPGFTPCTWLTTVSRDDLIERAAVLSSAKLSEIDDALRLAEQAQEQTPATTAKLSEMRDALRLGELGWREKKPTAWAVSARWSPLSDCRLGAPQHRDHDLRLEC